MQRTERERGSILIVMVLMTMPLLVLVSSAITTMTTRNYSQVRSIHNERALLAVESGLDQAIYISKTIGLTSGTKITRTLGPDFFFEVEPILASTDGIDNDGDTEVDEADENVFELTITGTYGRVSKRVVAYLGSTPGSMEAEAAVMTHNPAMTITFNKETPKIHGDDKDVDGGAGPEPELPGAAIAPPGTVADLIAGFSPCAGGELTGAGPDPSFGVTSGPVDFVAVQAEVQASATIVLTSTSYGSGQFGNASTGDWEVVYRNGPLTLENSVSGAGILFVNGRFHMGESARWDGIVYVIGSEKITLEDDAYIGGVLIIGPNVPRLSMEDDPRVQYSSEAIAGASGIAPGTGSILLSGWQEVPVN